jgi:hypothetical protein
MTQRIGTIAAWPVENRDQVHHAHILTGENWQDAANRIARKIGLTSVSLVESVGASDSGRKIVQFGRYVQKAGGTMLSERYVIEING